RRALRGRERLPRPDSGPAGPALPGRAARAPAHGGLGPEGDPRERRPFGRDCREAEGGAGEVPAALQRRRGSGARHLVPLPAIHARFWPAITRRESPPSSLPRLLAWAADECGLSLGASDPEAGRHYWKGH